jgi:S-adenosylmethionine synthetase
VSKSAGVLKRLQKTEVSISHTVPSKKVKKGGLPAGRVASTWGSHRVVEPVVIALGDRAEVQVPATPAPRKRDGL